MSFRPLRKLRSASRLLLRVPSSDYSSTLKMEAIYSAENLSSLLTTWWYKGQDRALHSYRCENLNSNRG
jgi:hypothetical protein